MTITDGTPHDLVPETVAPAPAPIPAPAAPPAPSPRTPESSDLPISPGLSMLVAIVTFLHPMFLFGVAPATPEGAEIAGYVAATTSLAMLGQLFIVIAAGRARAWLGKAMFGVVGLGLIAQAACAVDGHVSIADTHFALQVFSWLAYGIFAIVVTARTKTPATV